MLEFLYVSVGGVLAFTLVVIIALAILAAFIPAMMVVFLVYLMAKYPEEYHEE